MTTTKSDLCGFSGFEALGQRRRGFQILGAARTAARRPVTVSSKKTPAAAVASATAAATRAVTAGNAAVAASKRQPKTSKVLGLDETELMGLVGLQERQLIDLISTMGIDDKRSEHLLADLQAGIIGIPSASLSSLGLDERRNAHLLDAILGINERRNAGILADDVLGLQEKQYIDLLSTLGVDTDSRSAAYAAEAAYEIMGAVVSPEMATLLARSAATSAALSAAKAKAATAPDKVAKANASADRQAQALAVHQQRASTAGSKGQAALMQAKSASGAIADQVARLKKLGVRVIGADIDTDKQMYDKMPGDAVPFPLGKAFDIAAVGSWSMYYGVQMAGAGLAKIGYTWAGVRWAFVPITGNPVDLSRSDTKTVSLASTQGHVPVGGGTQLAGGTFGPLIGDPNNPEFAGLHYAVVDDKWFWTAGTAPPYATKEMDDAVALLAQQEQDAQAAADAAAQAAADQAQAQADAESAANQAAMDKIDAAAALASEEQAQRLQLQDDANQAAISQQQQKDDAAVASAQAQAQIAQAQYQAAHPELMQAQPQAQPQGGGGGGDGGDGYRDDAQDDGSPSSVADSSYGDDGGDPFGDGLR